MKENDEMFNQHQYVFMTQKWIILLCKYAENYLRHPNGNKTQVVMEDIHFKMKKKSSSRIINSNYTCTRIIFQLHMVLGDNDFFFPMYSKQRTLKPEVFSNLR